MHFKRVEEFIVKIQGWYWTTARFLETQLYLILELQQTNA